jgi:hypothetical protein
VLVSACASIIAASIVVLCCVMLCHGVQDDAILVADNDTVLCSTDSAFQPLYVEFFASNVAAA